MVIIKNKSDKTVDISGWMLLSVKGNQKFFFPNGTKIPGEKIKVVSERGAKDGENQLKWTGRYIWNNDGDEAELYNNNTLVSEMEGTTK